MGRSEDSHIAYMRQAFLLARKGEWKVSPNPKVGAVIVKNGRIIGRGSHRKFGSAHAEIEAISDAKRRGHSIRGAAMYITLEPCSHLNKKTPPCAPAILQAGIKEIFIAMKDPNPSVAGKSIRLLRKKRIKVNVGLLQAQARELNASYIKWIATGVPYVGIKAAVSLDGRIATKKGGSKWITSEKSRKKVYQIRNSYDAILVGVNTVLKDNPALASLNRQPLRVVLDSRLRISQRHKVLRDKNVIVATTSRAQRARLAMLQKKGFHVKIFGKEIKIPSLLRYLGQNGISSVLVEGGAKVFGSFVDAKCVDFAHWFVAPKIIGGKMALPAVLGSGISALHKALQIKHPQVKTIGNDVLIEGPLK